MRKAVSSYQPEHEVVLNVFCSVAGDDWRVMLNPEWAPQYLLYHFDENLEVYPVQLDLDDLDQTMTELGLQYKRRFAVTGSVELTATGEAADALATWLSAAFASSVRPVLGTRKR